jgi:hypothetical protein
MEAFVGGVLAKIYDDFTDNNIIGPGVFIEVLKASQWILFTLMALNDFNFQFILYFVNILNYLGDPSCYNGDHEKTLLILHAFLLILSFGSWKYFSIFDYFYILCFMCVMGIEPLIITEEFSYKKLISRIIISINLSIGLFIAPYFDISYSLIKFMYYSLGYALFSSGFQAYLLTSSTSI